MRISPLALPAFALLLTACNSAPTVVPPHPTSSSSSSSVAMTSSSSVATQGKDVIVETPVVNALVKSPLIVKGKARGTWFFEASMPVNLTDSNGNVIAAIAAKADGEWMTTDYVNFTVTIPFTTKAKSGFLVIKKDNPSGDPANDQQIRVPVNF